MQTASKLPAKSVEISYRLFQPSACYCTALNAAKYNHSQVILFCINKITGN